MRRRGRARRRVRAARALGRRGAAAGAARVHDDAPRDHYDRPVEARLARPLSRVPAMEHCRLGSTNVDVSRLILGGGGFGGFGSDHDLIGRGESEAEAAAIMDRAWELGITTF